ncbi:hypothetical protein DM82_3033 [Burkholderia oklahomensis]|uniref:Uncharacterized protein n=1 Tax=Burkholderia oklahomensis TaxID=342113 RepID=A0AAI8FNY2_9BURK|nr:hypothetical protein DM82_3033 [Burkholderia oklahomensis]AOI40896.1 hypothetical protein WG70_14160 [Burkholderia oklahomensis EO147]KUY51137.1 hypothetical protein WG70_17380 [Burkholderia oklahomensis EO147]
MIRFGTAALRIDVVAPFGIGACIMCGRPGKRRLRQVAGLYRVRFRVGAVARGATRHGNGDSLSDASSKQVGKDATT